MPYSGTRFRVWEIARACLCITKAERGALRSVLAAHFSASFISRVGASEREKDIVGGAFGDPERD